MAKKWYIIEGNIGSGKSTLLQHMETQENVEVIPEPVQTWLNIKDDENKNLLDHFYSDMNRNSYMFQTMVFKTRVESLDIPQVKDIRVSERSIWTDRYVFGKMCIDDKKMNSIETNCYKHWFEFLLNKFEPKPDGIIYVQCSPQKCLERIQKRHRNEETSISIDYLNILHKHHEDWLASAKWEQTPVLILDNEEDDNWDNVLNKVNKFIHNE